VPGEPGTGNRHLGWLAAGIAVASIAMAVAADILGVARGSSVKGVAPQTVLDVFSSTAFLALPVVGAVIARRQPRNAIVWPMHRGLQIGWIEDALAPLRGHLPQDELRQLVYGIGATLGIEAFVWLTDIGKISREDAVAIMRVNALRLLASAIPNGTVRDQ
jgi:hypothetical protein